LSHRPMWSAALKKFDTAWGEPTRQTHLDTISRARGALHEVFSRLTVVGRKSRYRINSGRQQRSERPAGRLCVPCIALLPSGLRRRTSECRLHSTQRAQRVEPVAVANLGRSLSPASVGCVRSRCSLLGKGFDGRTLRNVGERAQSNSETYCARLRRSECSRSRIGRHRIRSTLQMHTHVSSLRLICSHRGT
jgi:hypothetical protein